MPLSLAATDLDFIFLAGDCWKQVLIDPEWVKPVTETRRWPWFCYVEPKPITATRNAKCWSH